MSNSVQRRILNRENHLINDKGSPPNTLRIENLRGEQEGSANKILVIKPPTTYPEPPILLVRNSGAGMWKPENDTSNEKEYVYDQDSEMGHSRDHGINDKNVSQI